MSVAVMGRPEATFARTSWSMVVSVSLHVLLLAAIILFPRAESGPEPVTEITLLDPGESAAPAPAAAPAARADAAVAGAITAQVHEERFQRMQRSAETAPDPQVDNALDDRLNARLAALQTAASRPSPGVVASAAPAWTAPSAAVVGHGGTGGSPITLARGGVGSGPPLELARGGTGAGFAPASIATPAAAAAATPAPEKAGDASAHRTLAGATLMGPIADRAVVSHVTPVYPDWAKREGVEGSVTLYFVVRPDGSVRENVLVQKTAGFGDFDENARSALRAWRFEPLREGRVGEQWGTITFHFRLRDSG